MTVTLRILRGTLKDSRGHPIGGEIAVRAPRFTIGRAEDCQLRCASPLVDPYHCLITQEVDRIVIRDLNSTHGTFVNDVRIDRTACLFDGDELRVGRLEFAVVIRQPGRAIVPVVGWRSRSTAPSVIVPLRDTVPESVARRLEPARPRVHPRHRLTLRSLESASPRRS